MFRSLIGKVYFSEQGTPESTKEKATLMMFLDLLYQIESTGIHMSFDWAVYTAEH